MAHRSALAVVSPAAALATTTNTSGAESDEQLIAVWLSTKASANTRAAYAADAALFVASLGGRSLHEVSVRDMQTFIAGLTGATSTRARRVGAIKSLLSFGQRTGYLRFDVGRAVQGPKVPDKLAARILDVEAIHRLLAGARDGRDAVLLRLLYVSGARVSEVCGLTWGDCHARLDAGTATVHGKGEKSRTILLTARMWTELLALRADAPDTSPVFPSRTGRPLDRSAVLRIVRIAAKAARIRRPVSAHWFRHAHASHSLDRGAPVHLVSATLGHASLATTSRYTHAKPNDSSARYIDA